MGPSFVIALLRVRVAPQSGIQLSPCEIVYGWPFQATIGVGDMYTDQEMKVKKYIHLSQTLVVMNDLACIRDLSPTGLLHSFEPADKVLLKIWTTASPESQLEKWTGLWDVLLTTPAMVKRAEIKPWTHHTRVKKALEEDLKVIFRKQ